MTAPLGDPDRRWVDEPWDAALPGVLVLPSDRLVRGGRRALHPGALPRFGLCLAGRPGGPLDWDTRWIR